MYGIESDDRANFAFKASFALGNAEQQERYVLSFTALVTFLFCLLLPLRSIDAFVELIQSIIFCSFQMWTIELPCPSDHRHDIIDQIINLEIADLHGEFASDLIHDCHALLLGFLVASLFLVVDLILQYFCAKLQLDSMNGNIEQLLRLVVDD